MNTYWTNLNDRERWIVGIGIIFTLLYLIYFFVYSPLTMMVSDKIKQLKEKNDTLLWIQQVRQTSVGKKVPQSISNSKLLSIIASQLNTPPFQHFPHQLQQTNQGYTQLTFDLIPYNIFLTWLWTLTNDYSIMLKQFSVERTNNPGLVKLMAVITNVH